MAGFTGIAVGAIAVAVCFWTPQTRLADIAAVGSALATSLAVIVALYVSQDQIKVARHAAESERQTALDLQKAAREDIKAAQRVKAVRLAHAFSRELILARRDLMVFLVNIRPAVMIQPSNFILESFVSKAPLQDLALIRRFADQLDGFEDEHAFAILTLLSGWQSFNRGPGMNIDAILELTEERRTIMATNRSKSGHGLLQALERLVNLLAPYYESHESMQGTVLEAIPDELAKYFSHSPAPEPSQGPA